MATIYSDELSRIVYKKAIEDLTKLSKVELINLLKSKFEIHFSAINKKPN